MNKPKESPYVPFYSRWKWRPKLSLRMLLLMLTCAAFAILWAVGSPAQLHRKDQAIANELESLGTRVFFAKNDRPIGSSFFIRLGFEDIYKLVSQVGIEGVEVTEKHLQLLSQLHGPKFIRLSNCKPLDDESMAALSELDTLERIDLNGTGFTEEGLLHLEKLPQLERLNLRNPNSPETQLGYEALHRIEQRLPINLESEIPETSWVRIQEIVETDDSKKLGYSVQSPWMMSDMAYPLSPAPGYAPVDSTATQDVSKLKPLAIRKEFLTAIDFSVAWHVPLQVVEIPGDNDIDDLLPQLSQITSLEELLLPYNKVGSETLKHWRPLTELKVLNLRNSTEISDADIESLLHFQKLEVLNLGASSITSVAATKLMVQLLELHTLVLPDSIRNDVNVPNGMNVHFAEDFLPPRKNSWNSWSVPSEYE